MPDSQLKLRLTLTPKVRKQLAALPQKYRKQYIKAFQLLLSQGPAYRSLRTHRYRHRGGEIWGSSASMFLRFHWKYAAERTIQVMALSSH
ncbi:hypothetical protein [Lusitaniella coriacea]|uniref:hypothetical protein n=1 Tax=Lusitaniella coriacea TaxID=1983105 RepID=UPI003CEB4778